MSDLFGYLLSRWDWKGVSYCKDGIGLVVLADLSLLIFFLSLFQDLFGRLIGCPIDFQGFRISDWSIRVRFRSLAQPLKEVRSACNLLIHSIGQLQRTD